MGIEQNQLPMPDLPVESTTADDGGNSAADFKPSSAAPQQQQETERPQQPQQWQDERRAEIFNKAREKRLSETEDFNGDPNDPDALYGADVDQSDMGELEREALRRREEHLGRTFNGNDQQGQRRVGKPLNGIDPQFLAQPVPIKVDGEERTVTIEDLVRNYQIDQAASKRLEQAKALVAQTKEFQRSQPLPGDDAEYQEPYGQDETYQGDDSERNTSARNANIKDLVEKIQLGTPDEAAEALEEFVSSAVNRPPPVDETTRVLTALEDINSKQAVLDFAQKNPSTNNPAVQLEFRQEIHREMARDLMNAGYTQQDLMARAPTPQALSQLHKEARINRVSGVRSVAKLMEAAHQAAMTNLRGLIEQNTGPLPRNPAPSMMDRQQRKERLQTQPAVRRLSPSTTQQSPNRTLDQSRSAAVARMRQARGQPV